MGNRPIGTAARRLRDVNEVAATAFVAGGSLFAFGAALAQAGVAEVAYLSVYLVGGVFFSTGGYASLVQAINEPDEPGGLEPARWRWWSREPGRVAWLSAAVLFAGTLVFAINLVDSFIEGLGAVTEDRLVWSPDVVGCLLFLISGHLAMVGIAGGWRRIWGRRDLVPCPATFALSGLSSPRLAASSTARRGAATPSGLRPCQPRRCLRQSWTNVVGHGTGWWIVAGVMQEFERPAGPRRRRA